MFFVIYKITNLITNKFYIGKHQTKNLNDNYFGSGILLKRAIEKYGIDNFTKEILEVYDQEWKMNLAERILIVPDIEISYNLCEGGKGGWNYVNREIWTKEKRLKHNRRISGFKKLMKEDLQKQGHFVVIHKLGVHAVQNKDKLSDWASIGGKSTKGKIWIKKDQERKRIDLSVLDSYLKLGYSRGR